MIPIRRVSTVIALGVGAIIAQSAHATAVVPLDGNPHALLSGSQTFSAGILGADVSYAVFGPGVFTSETVGGMFDHAVLGGFDSAEDFVYAYQIHNSGSAPVTSLQLELIANSVLTDLGEDADADLSGISPTVITPIGSSSAAFFFVAMPAGVGQILTDEESTVLLLSSRRPPAFTNAVLTDSGIGAEGTLPTPVPEPSAICIVLTALCIAGAATLRKRTANTIIRIAAATP